MRTITLLSASLLLASVFGAPAQAQVVAPTVSVTDIKALPTPLPLPYDEEADADADVTRAFERARVNGKRVLLNFGGDWCPDCRVFAGITELPEVKGFVAAHYEVVKIDVGRINKNLHIPARYGVEKLRGVPSVLIVAADGTLLNASNSSDLTNARGMTPQAIADWLAKFAAPAKNG
ncbi:hypothetical protein CHU95_20260 [Niveispirillum lacus]|uniref:Thioredoxin domain-containing protein n=1 Tax=Niveispirillum lacus TaxID=1981099 RepID=A0A255YS62_9PROT|nr:thioredoxin family protein [Niveispirillum lacus]OYQ31485.1 hypothetical protein CHU95_20260 [Niveispirillum lacus]